MYCYVQYSQNSCYIGPLPVTVTVFVLINLLSSANSIFCFG